MKLPRIIWPLLICALLAACAVGPDYRQPTTPVPENWQAPRPSSEQTSTLNDWWAQFNDPELTQLLKAAQASSPSLAKAAASIEKARASRSSSAANGWPSLTANASGSESGSLRGNSGISRTASTALDASWELDLFGKVRRSVESADALLDARIADWHDARVSLAAEVAVDYVDYRACQIIQKYYEDEADSQAKTAQITHVSAQAGFSSTADARLAEASAASTRASALSQQAECDVLVKTLVNLTGMQEPDLRNTLAQGQVRLPEPAALQVSSVPAALLSLRPDVVSAERAVASASALIGVAEAARWPSLSLTGSIGINASQGSSPTQPWSFGPSLSLPIFDGGTISANIKSAKADYDSALASYQQTVRDAVKEVEQALVRLDKAASREEELRQSADGYRAYFQATQINWQAGGTSQLDLETARRSAISADLSLLQLQQNRLEYWIALYKALGGGWQASGTSNTQGDAQ
ncbi:efflux transporter outer membrane subunit [Uliginosibacterium gangwonense]|uniref:efflux transporter outer membrane subunit n=1 Tax=Uliginosibacterium gangwonense TaxID=392736 RepID=UPI00035E3A04|nr:efflux transporter outer membrane subunit [Uliginosibacterium gangwonense]